MNLNDLYENREPYQQAIDKLEQRRIEDLEAKMDDLHARARKALDDGNNKAFDALRHEFAKVKAERDSYHTMNEAPGAETLAHNQSTVASNEKALGLAEEDLEEHGGGGGGPRQWHAYVRSHRVNEADRDVESTIRTLMAPAYEEETGGQFGYTLEKKAPTMAALREKFHDDLNAILTQASPKVLAQAAQELKAMYGQVEEHGGGVNSLKNYISWRKSANKERGITSKQPVGKPDTSNGTPKRVPKGSVHGKLDQSRGVVPPSSFSENYVADTNYKYCVYVNGEEEGEYSSAEEAKDVVRTMRTRGPGNSFSIKRKPLTSTRSIKKFQRSHKHDVEEGWSNKMVARRTGQAPTPYSVYISGKEWKSFSDDDHAENVANKLRAKFKDEGRDPSVITIAPTDYDKGVTEAANLAQQAAIAINMKKHHQKPKNEARADDVNFGHTVSKGSWIVHQDGKKPLRFKTHSGAKGYAEKNGGKVYSSEFYNDKFQSKNEDSMDWAAHKPTGPKFSGYLKGTDPAPTEYGNKSFGAESKENPMQHDDLERLIAQAKTKHHEPDPKLHRGDEHEINGDEQKVGEGIDGNMRVRSTPMDLRTPKVVAPKLPGNKHSNALKKARAKGVTEDEVAEGAKVDRMQKHIAKSEKDLGHSKKDAESIAWATLNKRGYLDNKNKKKHNESVNFIQWAMENGYNNVTANSAVYKEAKEAYIAEAKKKTLKNTNPCWKGYHPVGTKEKDGRTVPNCVPGRADESIGGEYDDEAGMAKGNLYTISKAAQGLLDTIGDHDNLPEWVQEKIAKVEGMMVTAWNYLQSQKAQGIDPQVNELNEEFDLIESNINNLAIFNNVDPEVIWEDLEHLSDDELYVFAVTQPVMEDWQKANRKDKTSGMSRKAVKAYRREHPGSKLQTAVTTKPSKLKKGSKASKRRKSYCSRSRGQMKMHNISCQKTPDKAICKARRRWNCEGLENLNSMLAETMNSGGDLKPGQYYVWEVFFDDGSSKRIKVTKDNFDPKAYYAKQNKNVVNVEYNWDVHNG